VLTEVRPRCRSRSATREKNNDQQTRRQTAVITGGTEGIGLATAKLFVKEGAYVFIMARREKELNEAVTAIGSNVTGVQGDVAKLADLDRLYETVGKVKGRIDIIFANAGVGEFVPFGKVSEEHFDSLFNINVKGALFTVQKGLPLLNDGGSIILTGSVASIKALGLLAFMRRARLRFALSCVLGPRISKIVISAQMLLARVRSGRR